MAWEDLDKDRIEQIIRQISGKGLDKSKSFGHACYDQGFWYCFSLGSYQENTSKSKQRHQGVRCKLRHG